MAYPGTALTDMAVMVAHDTSWTTSFCQFTFGESTALLLLAVGS